MQFSTKFLFHIIYYTAKGCKSKAEDIKKFQTKTKFSIFIDEKIYSVDRLKIMQGANKENGFTYSKVWQNRKKKIR